MEWYMVIAVIVGGLLLLMATGLPVAFCFLLINLIGVAILWGPEGPSQLTISMFNAAGSFVYYSIPMYVLMGEILFHSGLATEAIAVVDKWLGALPGRLALLAMISGTIFAALCGSSMASAAMLGEVILPEMNKRGYKNTISVGSVIGAGGLAMMIPPSDQAVVWAAVAEVSIGKILIALIIPGLMLAALCTIYVVGRCWLQPSLAPSYTVDDHTPLGAKIRDTVKYALPVFIIILTVTGLVFLGIATPSEAAALGAACSVLIAILYKKMNKKIFWNAIMGAVRITAMLMLILVTSKAFSMILAYTGATRQFVEIAMSSHLSPMIMVIAMMFVVTFLGCFLATVPIMMITLPIFMPIVNGLHLNPIWFGIMFLINCEMGGITPPFGMMLFVAKGVAPKVSMGDIIKAGMPYVYIDLIAIALIMIFPGIVTWLPGLMLRKS